MESPAATRESPGREPEPRGDKDAAELDDELDRDELRGRYEILLQELRVVLPGVQVLLAFLLTAPFSARFERLDDTGRDAFLVAIASALASVICLLAPTVFHRTGKRTHRVLRLRWGIAMSVAGLWLLALSLVTSLWCVLRFVHGTAAANVGVAVSAATLLLIWLLIPLATRRLED